MSKSSAPPMASILSKSFVASASVLKGVSSRNVAVTLTVLVTSGLTPSILRQLSAASRSLKRNSFFAVPHSIVISICSESAVSAAEPFFFTRSQARTSISYAMPPSLTISKVAV